MKREEKKNATGDSSFKWLNSVGESIENLHKPSGDH